MTRRGEMLGEMLGRTDGRTMMMLAAYASLIQVSSLHCIRDTDCGAGIEGAAVEINAAPLYGQGGMKFPGHALYCTVLH